MVDYKVTIQTQDAPLLVNLRWVYITLIGTNGESTARSPFQLISSFSKGKVSEFTVHCSKDIGELQMIKLHKGLRDLIQWCPGTVEVETPTGKVCKFPIYHWISDGNLNSFREGTAILDFKETSKKLKYVRKKELREQQSIYCWDAYEDGIPECAKEGSFLSLPRDDSSAATSLVVTALNSGHVFLQMLWEKISWPKIWTSLKEIEDYCKGKTSEKWRKDSFFGYQFLNGLNPMVIKRIKSLPKNFPVADKVFKEGSVRLNSEMEKGNIFLCDYKILDKVKANTINGELQYLAAPLVLLHQTEEGMMPLAIQLKQEPGEDNPVFFPSDSEYDWLLAKLYVRSADFNLHELNYHLLRTHLLAEVFAIALRRNLPRVHPVYKILIRHTHDTLQINFLARVSLISEDGIFTKFTASGGDGMLTILNRSLSNLTYSSLCIPDDIKERGLEDVNNFYYRDDGLKLWEIMHSFVKETLSYYYKKDSDVKRDKELQNWIKEISEHGFLRETETDQTSTTEEEPPSEDTDQTSTTEEEPPSEDTGIPNTFTTVDELVKFVTMVMFTCSVQHAAVNSGQNDYYGLMLNGPSTMRKPPPTKKGEASEATILEALPDQKTAARIIGVVDLLSKPPSDGTFLLKVDPSTSTPEDFPEQYFTEAGPCEELKKFKEKLKALSDKIGERKEDFPYKYLDPKVVECSVDI